MRGYRFNFWKKTRKLCKQKQPPVVIAQKAILQCIYSALVAKNHQKFRSGFWVHEFYFTDVFNDINHGYRVVTLKKNCGNFLSLWLWLLIAIMKRCAEPCALQLYCTSLIYVHSKSKVTENIFNLLEWLQNTWSCKSLLSKPLFLSKHSPLKKKN